MVDTNKTVFISYRRNISAVQAHYVSKDLQTHKYDVFLDVKSIGSGQFGSIILKQIAARAHFIVILMPGVLDRCNKPDDWLRKEIECAIDLERNIIPLMFNGFRFDDARACLTGKLDKLSDYNGISVPDDYIEEALERLRTTFLKQPVRGRLVTVTGEEKKLVKGKVFSIAHLLKPTEEELIMAGWRDDHDGRGLYRFAVLTSPRQRPALVYEWKGYTIPPNHSWRYSKKKMEQLDVEGRIHYFDSGRRPVLKQYWTDIHPEVHDKPSVKPGLRARENVLPKASANVPRQLIKYGDVVVLRHAESRYCLYFDKDHPKFSTTSGYQLAGASQEVSEDNHWLIKKPYGDPSSHKKGQPVQHGDTVRLEHIVASVHLHSHTYRFQTPPYQQEVTVAGYGDPMSDANDNWRVEVNGEGTWDTKTLVRLIHESTNCALHSHKIRDASNQQEVTCYDNRDNNDWWITEIFQP